MKAHNPVKKCLFLLVKMRPKGWIGIIGPERAIIIRNATYYFPPANRLFFTDTPGNPPGTNPGGVTKQIKLPLPFLLKTFSAFDSFHPPIRIMASGGPFRVNGDSPPGIIDAPPLLPSPQAKINILRAHEETFIHSSQRIPEPTVDQHESAGDS